MKQYPDVYYTFNEMAELSGYDRKAFMDCLKRVGEMYDIPINKFKAYPDGRDCTYVFVPEVAEFLLIFVKIIDRHPLILSRKVDIFTSSIFLSSQCKN